MKPFICIGVPYWIGERIKGQSSIDVIREWGIADKMNTQWVDIQPDFESYDDSVVAVNVALAETITAHPDHIPMIFAGDCTSCLGAMKGLSVSEPHVLWFDAHGDFNTPETTPSGFLGGMPLAAMVGLGNEKLMAGIGLSPIAEDRVIITDARDLDPEEKVLLQESEVQHFLAIADLLNNPLPDDPIYLHFDTDIIHLNDVPAVVYPAVGGPSLSEISTVLRTIAQRINLAGILITLWNHSMDGADISMNSTLHLVREFVEAWRQARFVDSRLEKMEHRDWAVSSDAAYELIEMGALAIEPLANRLPSAKPKTQRMITGVLAKIGTPAIDSLIGVFAQHRGRSRRHIGNALVEIGDVAVAPLIELLEHEQEDARREAARALGRIGAIRAIDPLLQTLLNSDSRATGLTITSALTSIGAPAVEPLLQVLETTEDQGQITNVVVALGRIGDPRAIPALERIVTSSEDDALLYKAGVRALKTLRYKQSKQV